MKSGQSDTSQRPDITDQAGSLQPSAKRYDGSRASRMEVGGRPHPQTVSAERPS